MWSVSPPRALLSHFLDFHASVCVPLETLQNRSQLWQVKHTVAAAASLLPLLLFNLASSQFNREKIKTARAYHFSSIGQVDDNNADDDDDDDDLCNAEARIISKQVGVTFLFACVCYLHRMRIVICLFSFCVCKKEPPQTRNQAEQREQKDLFLCEFSPFCLVLLCSWFSVHLE